MTRRHFYMVDGKKWGPFTDDERAELDATARRPITWEAALVTMADAVNTDENPHPEWPIEPLCCSFHFPMRTLLTLVAWGCLLGAPFAPALLDVRDRRAERQGDDCKQKMNGR